MTINLIDKIIQFLAAVREGPFQRKGNGLQLLKDLLILVFASSSPEFKSKIKKCYKVCFILYISLLIYCSIQLQFRCILVLKNQRKEEAMIGYLKLKLNNVEY